MSAESERRDRLLLARQVLEGSTVKSVRMVAEAPPLNMPGGVTETLDIELTDGGWVRLQADRFEVAEVAVPVVES